MHARRERAGRDVERLAAFRRHKGAGDAPVDIDYAQSMSLTLSVAAFETAPVGGLVESIGRTARQIVKTICSRDTEFRLVFGLLPNNGFIIEFDDGRY